MNLTNSHTRTELIDGTKEVPGAATVLDNRSRSLRRTIVEMLEAGGRGHVGSAFSTVEIIRVLYDDVMTYDAKEPKRPDRDRFILSKGQGCMALYAVLADKGFFPTEELSKFCIIFLGKLSMSA